MSLRTSRLAKPLLAVAGLLVVFVGLKALTGGSAAPAEGEEELTDPAKPVAVARANAEDGEHSKQDDLISYGVGYILALVLTCVAFALVYWRWTNGVTAIAVVFGLALVQALVHFRCFLHVSLRRSARDDLQLVLFSTAIVCLMVGGTLVVLFNLRMRMM